MDKTQLINNGSKYFLDFWKAEEKLGHFSDKRKVFDNVEFVDTTNRDNLKKLDKDDLSHFITLAAVDESLAKIGKFEQDSKEIAEILQLDENVQKGIFKKPAKEGDGYGLSLMGKASQFKFLDEQKEQILPYIESYLKKEFTRKFIAVPENGELSDEAAHAKAEKYLKSPEALIKTMTEAMHAYSELANIEKRQLEHIAIDMYNNGAGHDLIGLIEQNVTVPNIERVTQQEITETKQENPKDFPPELEANTNYHNETEEERLKRLQEQNASHK